MNQINKQISNNIKQLRKRNHLTQEQLAEKLFLDTQYYAQLERGERNFTIEKIVFICELFQIEVNEIIDLPKRESEESEERTDKLTDISQKLTSLTFKQLQILEKYIDEVLPLQK